MTEDSEQEPHGHDDRVQSNYYGLAPGIAGVLFGLALIAFMFALADGFA
jgi:hypothetical protein